MTRDGFGPGTPSVVASHAEATWCLCRPRAISGVSCCCVSLARRCIAVDGNRWCKLFGDLSNTCPEYHKFQTTRAFAVIEILAAGLFTVALFSNAQGAGQRIAALAFGVLASTSPLPFLSSLSSLTPSRPTRPSLPLPLPPSPLPQFNVHDHTCVIGCPTTAASGVIAMALFIRLRQQLDYRTPSAQVIFGAGFGLQLASWITAFIGTLLTYNIEVGTGAK